VPPAPAFPGGDAFHVPPARRRPPVQDPEPDGGVSFDTMGRPMVLWPPPPRRRPNGNGPEDTGPPDFDAAPPPPRRVISQNSRAALSPPPNAPKELEDDGPPTAFREPPEPRAPREPRARPTLGGASARTLAPGRSTRRAGEPPPAGRASRSTALRDRPLGSAGRRRTTAKTPRSGFIRELPFLLIIAVVLAILVKGMVVQAFYIPSGSMENTLKIGDRVLVNRLAYRFGEPKHGQVIVFYRPDPKAGPQPTGVFGFLKRATAQGLGYAPPGTEDLIKRVIGEPGDVLFARNGKVWRNGKPIDEPYIKPGVRTSAFGPIRVPEGHVWVMGDNRENSEDSRRFGPVPKETFVGRAVVLIWPFGNVGGL
jgi:signal peptidase I